MVAALVWIGVLTVERNMARAALEVKAAEIVRLTERLGACEADKTALRDELAAQGEAVARLASESERMRREAEERIARARKAARERARRLDRMGQGPKGMTEWFREAFAR